MQASREICSVELNAILGDKLTVCMLVLTVETNLQEVEEDAFRFR